jgi:hypothetical protein
MKGGSSHTTRCPSKSAALRCTLTWVPSNSSPLRKIARIAVEIKSFVSVSAIYEFHLAIGQYRNYQLALSQEDPERVLYLAVPDDAYDRFFRLLFIQDALRYNEIRDLVYDVRRR